MSATAAVKAINVGNVEFGDTYTQTTYADCSQQQNSVYLDSRAVLVQFGASTPIPLSCLSLAPLPVWQTYLEVPDGIDTVRATAFGTDLVLDIIVGAGSTTLTLPGVIGEVAASFAVTPGWQAAIVRLHQTPSTVSGTLGYVIVEWDAQVLP